MRTVSNRPNGRRRVTTSFPESEVSSRSRTQQQFKEETDVNNIIRKYQKTGEFTHLARKKGVYADVSKITDYHDSLNKVMSARDAFASLPSDLRLRFANDPSQLLAFLQDPKNYDEGVKLGLYEPKQKTIEESQNQNDPNDTKNNSSKKTTTTKVQPKPEPDGE